MKIAVCFLFLALAASFVQSTEVVCYFTNWATYRSGIAKFSTSDIDSSLCTIINYAFVGVWGDTGELRVLDSWSDDDLGNLEGVLSLKENNTDLKVLVSMGGWNEGSANYSNVAGNATLRSNFVASVLEYLETNNFDGFDLDWEYPATRNGSSDDVENFITLLSELKSAFESYGYLLTVAVAGAGDTVETSYNVTALMDVVDFVNLMLYDFRTASSVNYTAHHAPLNYSSVDTTEDTQILSVIGGVQQWLDLGANASKLIVGLPFYGRTFTLVDADDNGLGAPTNGSGPAGPLTATSGFLSYQEICYYYQNFTTEWDDQQHEPHAYLDTTWFGYDNVESIKLKTQYALDMGLAGLMIWTLDYDDFNDSCGNGTYPLLSAINEVIASASSK